MYFIAAVEVVDAFDDGFAAGDQACHDEAGGGAQVGCHDDGAGEFFHAFDEGGVAFGGDVRAHAVEFGNVHEAVFKDGFDDAAVAFGNGVHRHKLRLHVGREAGVFGSADVYRFRSLLHVDGNPVVARFDDGAGFDEFVQNDFHGFGGGFAQDNFAAGHGDGAEEGTGFDAVGNDAVFAAVQLFHAFDGHGGSTDAADFSRPF